MSTCLRLRCSHLIWCAQLAPPGCQSALCLSSLSHQTFACLQGAVQSFAVVCEAFASWHTIRSKHLEGELHRVLQLFRSGLDNGSWEQALSKLSPAVRTQMERMASASA